MNILTYLRVTVKDFARELGASEEGATATEYVFLLVFIALVIIGGATLLGDNLDLAFSGAGNEVGNNTP